MIKTVVSSKVKLPCEHMPFLCKSLTKFYCYFLHTDSPIDLRQNWGRQAKSRVLCWRNQWHSYYISL